MSFSSVPSFRSGAASPSKLGIPTPSQLQNVMSPSSLSNRSESPMTITTTNYIPWNTSQGKLYKSIGEESWKRCERIVSVIFWYIEILIFRFCFFRFRFHFRFRMLNYSFLLMVLLWLKCVVILKIVQKLMKNFIKCKAPIKHG